MTVNLKKYSLIAFVFLLFTILILLVGCDEKKEDIKNCNISLEYIETVFDGSSKQPSVSVNFNNEQLILNKDYYLEYSSNINVGNASIKIVGIGDFEGSKSVEFKITKKQLKQENLNFNDAPIVYNGDEITPQIDVIVDSNILSAGSDYAISYENNVNVGNALIKIEGIGNYEGILIQEFEILPRDFNNVNIVLDNTVFNFIGYEIVPNYSIYYNEDELINGQDYNLIIENNINVGEVEMTFVGLGNYSGQQTKKFVIEQTDISILKLYFEDEITVYNYTGQEIQPQLDEFCLEWNGYIITEKDFRIEYYNNINPTTLGDAGAYALIYGLGNFKGITKLTFSII